MQHVFPHQNPYPPDWQHQQHAQTHHQYAQTQAAAAANAAAQQHQQQQQYGRVTQNGNSSNGNGMAALNTARDLDHATAPGSGGGGGAGSMMSPDQQMSEENRKVLEWIAQVLNASTRESALLELSKKREQVPELALILWHSFGMIQPELYVWTLLRCWRLTLWQVL